MRTSLPAFCIIGLCAMAACPAGFGAIVADLRGDWSDAFNPNVTATGEWTYREGVNALPLVGDWTPLGAAVPQPAWAPGNTGSDIIPAIFRSSSDMFDWLEGDIVIHSTDPTVFGIAIACCNRRLHEYLQMDPVG